MNIALLTGNFPSLEIKRLAKEFPEYLFISAPRHPIETMSKQQWSRIEILYGEKLSAEELQEAPQLRWIHAPSSNLNRLCLRDIEKNGNILITTTNDEQYFQIGEFILAAILAFTKNLFQWKEADRYPHLVWDCKWRSNMETLNKKILLQVGMGKAGQEIARRAYFSGMKVWSMDTPGSYHANCSKNFSFNSLATVLPQADIISIALPRNQVFPLKLGDEELKWIKNGAILTILGSPKMIDEEALLKQAPRFKGILLDAYYQSPIHAKSKLWEIPNLLITPEVSPRPKQLEKSAIHTFRYNLRQYRHDNYADMKNLIDPEVLPIQEFS